MPRKDILDAHKHSSRHKKEVLSSDRCGCFYCLKIFKPKEIKNWAYGEDAICPYCSIDSVIGSNSGYPITKKFLNEMCEYWFDSE